MMSLLIPVESFPLVASPLNKPSTNGGSFPGLIPLSLASQIIFQARKMVFGVGRKDRTYMSEEVNMSKPGGDGEKVCREVGLYGTSRRRVQRETQATYLVHGPAPFHAGYFQCISPWDS